MARETTLVLVKPDGMQRGLAGEIVARFERRGLELRGARLLKIPKPTAREHYAEHRGKPFFGSLVDFITSGPVLALAVSGESAISVVRTMMGATNPLDSAPGTIRGRLRARAVREHRPRVGLEGERPPRAGAVLPRRSCLSPTTSLATARSGRRPTRSTRTRRPARDGATEESGGACSACPRTTCASSGTSTGSTSSSSDAARRTSLPGSHRRGLARSAWTSRRPSSRLRADAWRRRGSSFPLVEASAEDVPLADAEFDLAFSEYGASIWCDPTRWIPEAARLLRPGGRLVFLTTRACSSCLCVPDDPGDATRELQRPYEGCTGSVDASRTESSSTWRTGNGSMSCAERASRSSDLVELYAPDGARTPRVLRRWHRRVGWQVARRRRCGPRASAARRGRARRRHRGLLLHGSSHRGGTARPRSARPHADPPRRSVSSARRPSRDCAVRVRRLAEREPERASTRSTTRTGSGSSEVRRTFDRAVSNATALFDAAKRAGVRRIVHVSVANPALDSPFPYFRGKARVEEAPPDVRDVPRDRSTDARVRP